MDEIQINNTIGSAGSWQPQEVSSFPDLDASTLILPVKGLKPWIIGESRVPTGIFLLAIVASVPPFATWITNGTPSVVRRFL